MLGPRAPERIAIVPAAVFDSIFGTNIGLTRPGPLSRYRGYSSAQVSAPPIPDPIMTPVRSASTRVIRSSPSSDRPA
jgi:hypothetical protein